jgi:hypothetical protein
MNDFPEQLVVMMLNYWNVKKTASPNNRCFSRASGTLGRHGSFAI